MQKQGLVGEINAELALKHCVSYIIAEEMFPSGNTSFAQLGKTSFDRAKLVMPN